MIRLTNVWYWAGNNQILADINLHVDAGDFVCIIGPSGAGKTSLLSLIHMENFPTRGRVVVADFDSETIRENQIPLLRRKVSFIFQDFKLLEDRDVFENVAFALWATGVRRRRIKKRVFQVLAEVSLSHKRYSKIQELSGGEQQRVAIARALANEPFVLLADEPTGNLDSETTNEILDLLLKINRKGTAIVMATHKEEFQKKIPARVVMLREGRIVE